MFRMIVGTSAVAGISFFIGKYSNEDSIHDSKLLRNAKAATSVPVPSIDLPVIQKAEEVKIEPSRAAQIMTHGWPGFDNLRTFEDFVLSYDRKTKTAHWVCEHLTPERLVRAKDVDRKKCEFKADASMHPYFASQNTDYFRSGFDRGHLAAAGNHRKSQLAVDQTFYLTNMSPQVGKGFNRDKWNELEMYCRKVAKHTKNTYIVTGPMYLPKVFEDGKKYVKYQVIGENNVAVPTHFFKAVIFEVSENAFELEAFILPNEVIPDSTDLSKFHVPLDAIERQAGLLVFDKIPKASIKKVNRKAVNAGLFW